jgi:three-Cys-motif partner protein
VTSNRNERQFEEYRSWQWCKHLTLGWYATPWSEILGSLAREIYVVDTHAGRGTYVDPTSGSELADGSAVIFARRAASYTAQRGPGKSMKVICVEKNRHNYAALAEALAPYQPHVRTFRGPLARYVPTIVETIGNAPALVLLDPIGLKTIAAEDWRPLLERQAKTDLFIVLHFGVVHRIGGWLLPDGTPNPAIRSARVGAKTIDSVFRTDAWRAVALDPALYGDEHREERERRYLQLFFDHVIGARHDRKCAFPVRPSYHAPVVYWLVHASDDLKPYLLMNDLFVKLDEMLLGREWGLEGQIEGMFEQQLEARQSAVMAELEHAVIDCLAESIGGRLPFGAIRDKLLSRFFGRVKQGAYSKAVKALVKSESVTREERAAAALHDGEIITLRAPTLDVGGAAVIRLRRAG